MEQGLIHWQKQCDILDFNATIAHGTRLSQSLEVSMTEENVTIKKFHAPLFCNKVSKTDENVIIYIFHAPL